MSFNTEKSLTTRTELSSNVGITEGGVLGDAETMGGVSVSETAHLQPHRLSASTVHLRTFMLKSCKGLKMNDKLRPQPGGSAMVSIFSGLVALGMRNDTEVRTTTQE